jgi:hypothetical protein
VAAAALVSRAVWVAVDRASLDDVCRARGALAGGCRSVRRRSPCDLLLCVASDHEAVSHRWPTSGRRSGTCLRRSRRPRSGRLRRRQHWGESVSSPSFPSKIELESGCSRPYPTNRAEQRQLSGIQPISERFRNIRTLAPPLCRVRSPCRVSLRRPPCQFCQIDPARNDFPRSARKSRGS